MEDALHYLEERDLDGIHFTNRKAIRNVTWNTSGCTTNRHRPTNLQIGIPRRTARLFILSSQDKEGLNRQRQSFCKFLRSYQEQQQDESQENQHYLRDLAFTLSERRSSLPWKTSFVTSTVDELCSALDNKDQEIRDSRTSGKPRIGFVFTGQGAQWARMACELNRYRIFRDSIEASAEYLQSALKCDWWAVEELSRGRDESNIDLPAYSQPLCTIIQVALVDLLKTWNVVPSVVVGHSSGEIAAAYCTGVLTKQDALKIAYYRGFFSSMISKYSSFQQGAMLAIETSESEVQEWISRVSDGKIVVACINSPRSVTVSGELTGINALQGLAKRYGKFARHLKVDVAYHSPQMDSISAQYYAAIQDLRPHPGTQAPVIYSSTAGCLVEPSELGPIHWVRNLVGPVLFYQALLELMRPGARESNDTANGVDLLVEIGPHSTLQGAIAQSMETHAITDIEYSSILSRGRNGVETALATMGSLFAQGVNVDMAQVNMDDADDIWGDPRMLADLPPYSWNHTRTFWSESRISKEYCFRKQPPGSLVGAPCSSGSENEKSWRKLIRMSEEPWIRHHKIQNAFVYPAAGYIAMVIEAARQMVDMQTVREFCLRDVQIIAPAVLDEESDLECILQLRPHRIGTRDNSSAWFEFTISTCGKEESLRQNCFGLLFIGYEAEEGSGTSVERFEEDQGFKDQHLQAQSSCRTWKDPKVFYDNLANLGLEYGDFFKNLTQIYTSSGKSCCTISFSNVGLLDMDADVKRPHIIHPTNLDAFFHCAFAAMEDQNQLQEALVPTSIDEVTISATVPFGTGTSVRGFSHIEQHGFRQLMADIVIFEHSLFESVVKVKGLCCSPIGPRSGKEAMVKEGTIKTRIDKMVWKPAIGLMSRHQLAHVIGQASAKCSVLTRSAKMERLILYFISRALHRLSIDEVDQTYLPHLYKFLEQHQKLAKSHEDCGLRDVKIEWSCMGEEEQTSARAEMVSLGINYDSICRVGMHFEDLLLGRKQMKDILCGQDLVDLIASLSSQVDGGFEMLSAVGLNTGRAGFVKHRLIST